MWQKKYHCSRIELEYHREVQEHNSAEIVSLFGSEQSEAEMR